MEERAIEEKQIGEARDKVRAQLTEPRRWRCRSAVEEDISTSRPTCSEA
jgi:hypothetical protein